MSPSASAADRVYWANDGFERENRVSFANLDGSGGGGVLDTRDAPGGHPRGLAIDMAAGKVYWTQPGTIATDGLISWTRLDGSPVGSFLNTSGATRNHPNGAAVYPAAGKIYWANEDGNRISFANLDNTGGGGDLNTTGAEVQGPLTPMVDPGSGRIYWANVGMDPDPPEVDGISFANLDGSGGGNLNTGGAKVANPHGVALDPVTRRIYWANLGAHGVPDGDEAISYANLDGSGGGDLNTTGAMLSDPSGVAIDPSTRRIYWANQLGNTISWANLDGGGRGTLNTTGAILSGSRSPVLLKAPSGDGAPVITGGARAPSPLTCTQGSWAQDLLASWLYRAPHTLAYSWTRNGAAVPGAAGSTYTPSAGGDYRCTVTASNPAGSSSQTSAAHAVSPPDGGHATSPRAFGAKTLVTISVAARRIRGRGPIKVVIRNGNGFRVSGTLSAKRMRGSRAFAVGARAKTTVRLKLSKTLRRLLGRQGKLSLRFTAKVKDPAGNTRTVRKKVSLKLKKSG